MAELLRSKRAFQLWSSRVSHGESLLRAAKNSQHPTPGAVLTAWLRRFFVYFTSKREVAAELLQHTAGTHPSSARAARASRRGRAAPPGRAAFRRGPRDLTLEQVLDLVIAVARVEGEGAYVEPILRAALDGLRPAWTRAAVWKVLHWFSVEYVANLSTGRTHDLPGW